MLPLTFQPESPPAQPSKSFHNAEGPRSSLDTIAGVRAEGEVGIQRDTQDFRGSLLKGRLFANSHLCGAKTGGYPNT